MSLEILGAWTPAPSLDDVRAGKATIKNGMSGASVEYVQGLLGVTPADKLFGKDTEAAVKALQKKNLISETGVVNQATIVALDMINGGPGQVADITQSLTVEAKKPAVSVPKDRQYEVTIVEPPTNTKKILAITLPIVGGILLGGGTTAMLWAAHRALGAFIGALVGAGAGFTVYMVTTPKEKVEA